ncbi:MAG TPA: ABATE domain-containing protein, partial [Gaiella sp.]
MPDDFQPGGRLPAPGPLRLVQDFVNTEIPDFDRDDLATPAALAAWLAERRLAASRDRVDGALFAEARALRVAL